MTRKTLRRAMLLASALATLTLAGAAEARQETVRWTQDLGDQVSSFHIFVGSSPGAADLLNQPIGVPTPDGAGIYSFTLDVDSESTLYVRLTAINGGDVHSSPSNEVSLSVALGIPGTPIVVVP